jgi:hypothetical protein
MIYVDPLMNHGWRLRGRFTPSCHLWTDSEDLEELHAFAKSIGLERRWFQSATKPRTLNHYDLTPSKRTQAIAAGAIELNLVGAVNAWRWLWGDPPLVSHGAS